MAPEGRSSQVPRGRRIAAGNVDHVYAPWARVLAGGSVPLESVPPGCGDGPMRIAAVVPPFGFGSGGHLVVFELLRGLEACGHTVSVFLDDPHDEQPASAPGLLRHMVREQYVELDAAVYKGFDHWGGADVVLATGWQTAYPVMGLAGCRARAYLVNDHEPEFYPTSLESLLAEQTYRLGMPAIVGGGPWLSTLLAERYGTEVVARFAYPVHEELVPRDVRRREDTIVVYGRDSTPRRAVGLALMALAELKRRRPGLRVVMFGDEGEPVLPFFYEHLGRVTAQQLSWVYSEGTVGLAFSLTHGSLVPHDMMACGLPVVDLDGFGTAAEHAQSGLVELAAADPASIADAVERLLDDPAERARRSDAGREYAAAPTWSDAAANLETGLRRLLAARSHVAL